MNSTLRLTEFADQESSANIIPWAQVVNPKNMSLADIRKFKLPWGIFIAGDQATQLGFKPDANWTETSIEFVENEPKPGFITNKLRMVVLHRAATEVQKYNGSRWEYLDLFFNNGWVDKLKSMPPIEKKNYRTLSRFLVIFLDSNNQALHNGVLQISLRGAFATAIGKQLTEYYKDLEKAFYAQFNAPAKTIKAEGRARLVVDFGLTLHRHESNSPSIYAGTVSQPTLEKGAHKDFTTTLGKAIKYVGADIKDLVIPIETPLGKQIISYFKEYNYFALPNKGYGEKPTQPIPAAVKEAVEELDNAEDIMPF